jgi:hypothetical protein
MMLWQIGGFFLYFERTHAEIKKEVKLLLKQGVPKEDLVIFSFTAQEMRGLVWLKKNEFNLGGNLFDVVRRRDDKNGGAYLECISDTKETTLFQSLQESVASNLGDKHHPTPLFSWMEQLLTPRILAQNTLLFSLMALSIPKDRLFFLRKTYGLIFPEISVPPPR